MGYRLQFESGCSYRFARFLGVHTTKNVKYDGSRSALEGALMVFENDIYEMIFLVRITKFLFVKLLTLLEFNSRTNIVLQIRILHGTFSILHCTVGTFSIDIFGIIHTTAHTHTQKTYRVNIHSHKLAPIHSCT